MRPPYKQNEFGVTGGGPIKKDKAFIFGYYDGFRLEQGESGYLQTIPTAEMMQGNFTHYGTGDPATSNWPDSSLRSHHPDNLPHHRPLCRPDLQ